MRPYIIINGVPSTRIEGLIISTLPSISKPQIRANIENIDGRDGDLITKLGYSAYDKTITIGLSKDYDIDEVISYFNSSGKITFSNEPDKYYIFSILEAIDFEKLIRFKTATVNIHVQPFKYSIADNTITYTFNNVSEGSFKVRNSGNFKSKPILTITGTGTTTLYLNDNIVLTIALGDTVSTIAIDVEELNAYDPTTLIYKNRDIVGDYEDLMLDIGSNTISFSGGSVESISINNYSRWI